MEWFLVRSNEHFGPFSTQVVHDLHAQGEVGDSDLLWKEGWDDAKPYSQIFAEPTQSDNENSVDELEEEVPPPLPPNLLQSSETNSKKTKAENVEVKVPVVKEQSSSTRQAPILDNEVDLSEYEAEMLEPDLEAEFIKKEKNSKFLKSLKLASILFMFLAVLIPAWMYYLSNQEMFSRPSSMSMKDFNKLMKVASNKEQQIQFASSLAVDKSRVWFATNVPLRGRVNLRLKSMPNKILGQKVEIEATGILDKHLIEFNNLKFIKGTKLVDGEYSAELYTDRELEVPFYQRFFSPKSRQFRHSQKFLITNLDLGDFRKQLDKFNRRKARNSDQFWEELVQKYLTVISITTEIKNAIETIFKADPDKFQLEVINFNNDYKSRYGVFFTSFVTANNQSYDRLAQKDFDDKVEIMANYNALSRLATSIGDTSMDAIDKLSRFNRMKSTNKEYDELKEKILQPLVGIIEDCKSKVQHFSVPEQDN